MTSEKYLGSEWHTDFAHVGVLLTHLRMAWLLKHLPSRLVWAVYVGINRLRHHWAACLACPRYR